MLPYYKKNGVNNRKMKQKNKHIKFLILSAVLLLLSGILSCSTGGHEPAPEQITVPADTSAAVTAAAAPEETLPVTVTAAEEEVYNTTAQQTLTDAEPDTSAVEETAGNLILSEILTEPQTAPPETLPREPAELNTETLLEDFDRFIGIIEENFPFYGTARRKYGLDLYGQKTAARAAVEQLNTARQDSQILRDFTDILSRYIITPLHSMGHMRGLWAGSQAHEIQLALIKWDAGFEVSWYPNLYAAHLNNVFTSPAALRYYGDPLAGVDIDSYLQKVLFTPVPNNVTFDIIQPDSVAYMKIRAMNSANFYHDGELIADFGATIGNFDHLIIDIRGNQGGSADYFTWNVVAPLISEPASLFYYLFFKDGQHAKMFDELYYRDLQWQIANNLTLHRDAPRFPIGELLPDLPYANADDFAELSYGIKREITVQPSAERLAFDGKIWLLVDRLSFSASEISAALAKESGFATLVGESTGGIFGGYTAAFIGLPNTGAIIRYDYGYATDLQGRSLEEFGVSPHIFNRPGMDALQTVLALIAEGGG